ncbi:MAG TPA: tyrosine-type recombinase/integrase [Devosia sp.]|jgi:site-specific recombinase XerD|uniref:tyrosine-type recombinase/integrase n=1 Tax=Devosia sp. TaxID=1871048 RepID=UPI002F93D7ED
MRSWRKLLQRLDGAYSDHTLRSYRSDFGAFARWCRTRRLRALPAEPSTMVAYIDAEGQRLKPSTIKRRLCALRRIHGLCDARDPTDHEDVRLALRRVRRAQPSRPQQAHGITAALRDKLLAACTDDLIGLRDKVLVSVGFDTLCRRGELVALSVDDFTPTADGRFTVLVRRAKNDPEGAGRTSRLSQVASDILRTWLSETGIKQGALLRPIYGKRPLALYLEPLTVGRVLKKLCDRAGVQMEIVAKVSGHSLRVGAAQQLTINGLGLPQIMRAGGWKSVSVVARYIEHVDLDVWV